MGKQLLSSPVFGQCAGSFTRRSSLGLTGQMSHALKRGTGEVRGDGGGGGGQRQRARNVFRKDSCRQRMPFASYPVVQVSGFILTAWQTSAPRVADPVGGSAPEEIPRLRNS